MVGLLWEIGAIIWVVFNGNISIGMMYVAVGMMFVSLEKNHELRNTAIVLGLVAIVMSVVKFFPVILQYFLLAPK